MKSKTEILAQLSSIGPAHSEWGRALEWVLDGEGWRDVDKELPMIGKQVLVWDDDSLDFLIARYYHNQGQPPTWVVCDKDRRTNITEWTYLE